MGPQPRTMAVTSPFAKINWSDSHRIIRSIYPPVWLFEDIADPADGALIAGAKANTNPRMRDETGDLTPVPVTRRVAGPGARIVMGALGWQGSVAIFRVWRAISSNHRSSTRRRS